MDCKTRNEGKIISKVLAVIGVITLLTMFAGTLELTKRGLRAKARTVVDSTSKVLTKARSEYEEALGKFDTQKEKYTKELVKGKDSLLTFREVLKTAQDEDEEFAKVSAQWEVISSEVKLIREKFTSLTSNAAALYTAFEDRANCITGEHLRTIALDKIAKSKKLYVSRLEHVKLTIDKLDATNTTVSNVMIALEIDYGLGAMEAMLDKTFLEIDAMIEAVMIELEKLSQESNSLLAIRLERTPCEVAELTAEPIMEVEKKPTRVSRPLSRVQHLKSWLANKVK